MKDTIRSFLLVLTTLPALLLPLAARVTPSAAAPKETCYCRTDPGDNSVDCITDGTVVNTECGDTRTGICTDICPQNDDDVDFGYVALSSIDGAGAGPTYFLDLSVTPVSVGHFVGFLNDAEANPSSPRGSNLVFSPNGDVGVNAFAPQSIFDIDANTNAFFDNGISYDPGLAPGERYARPLARSHHPIVGVTWYGAVKYCNWLTIAAQVGVAQRCYAEGPDLADWHPATISSADWATRDLDAGERQALADDYRGFRLPMDNLGGALGWIGGQENPYNEWYQGAAFDALAPAFPRPGPGGETVSPLHWVYSVGRDSIGPTDANYLGSGDPYEAGPTFVSFFDGSDHFGAFPTTANANAATMYDASGNVSEWCQDRVSLASSTMAVRGGSWASPASEVAASFRAECGVDSSAMTIGFRVMQVSSDSSLSFRTNQHFALGQASLARVGTEARIRNIGPGGTDGASIRMGSVGTWDLDLVMGAPPDPGRALALTAFGQVGASPDSMFATAGATGTGAGVQYGADYASAGAPTYRVQVLDGITPLASRTAVVGLGAEAPTWPDFVVVGAKDAGSPRMAISFGWKTAQLVSLPGVGAFNATEIVLEPEGATTAVAALSRVDLRATSVDSIAVVSESKSPVGTLNIPDVNVVSSPVGKAETSFALGPARPTPARDRVALDVRIAHAQRVRLDIYDVRGRVVRSLVDRTVAAGSHTIPWNRRSNQGDRVPSGVYLARLEVGDSSRSVRVLIVD